MLDEGGVSVSDVVSMNAIVIGRREVCEAIAGAGIVSSDDSSSGPSSGAADGSEGGPVLVRGRSAMTAAEAFEVRPVELPTEFACNKRNIVGEIG